MAKATRNRCIYPDVGRIRPPAGQRTPYGAGEHVIKRATTSVSPLVKMPPKDDFGPFTPRKVKGYILIDEADQAPWPFDPRVEDKEFTTKGEMTVGVDRGTIDGDKTITVTLTDMFRKLSPFTRRPDGYPLAQDHRLNQSMADGVAFDAPSDSERDRQHDSESVNARRCYTWEDGMMVRIHQSNFGSVPNAAQFLRNVMASEGDMSRIDVIPDRAGCRDNAIYWMTAPAVIELGRGRALTKWVILHEYAHHRTRNHWGHSGPFVRELCRLIARYGDVPWTEETLIEMALQAGCEVMDRAPIVREPNKDKWWRVHAVGGYEPSRSLKDATDRMIQTIETKIIYGKGYITNEGS